MTRPRTALAGATVGQVFVGPALRFSRERILAFSAGLFGEPGWPSVNLHTSRDKAHEAGLPDMIASGTQFEGHLADFLVDLAGEAAWFGSGQLRVRIPKSVMVDDVVTPTVTVTGVAPEADGMRLELEVVSRNQNGDVVLKGTASARVPLYDAPAR